MNNSEVFSTVNVITPMKNLKESYSEKVGMPVTDLRFMFLNLRINDDETPKILNLMDGDIIQVIHKGNGCVTDDVMYDIVDKITASDSNRLFPMLKVEDTSDHPMSISCCPQGHIVFQVYWRPRITSCLICSKDLLPILQPASILENVLHHCKFSYNGCAIKMRPKFLEIHEDQCIHRGKFSVDKEIIKIKLSEKISFPKHYTTEIHYRVKMNSKMRVLKRLHSIQMGFSGANDLSFLFDGCRMKEEDTPRSLEMEKDDVVYVLMQQSGS